MAITLTESRLRQIIRKEIVETLDGGGMKVVGPGRAIQKLHSALNDQMSMEDAEQAFLKFVRDSGYWVTKHEGDASKQGIMMGVDRKTREFFKTMMPMEGSWVGQDDEAVFAGDGGGGEMNIDGTSWSASVYKDGTIAGVFEEIEVMLGSDGEVYDTRSLHGVIYLARLAAPSGMAASGHRMAAPGQQLPPVPGRLPEGKSLVEAYRRGRGGGGVTRRSNNEDDQIAHIMRERGVNYERAEQILTDIYDDVGHDDGLVADAVYGHPMDYDED